MNGTHIALIGIIGYLGYQFLSCKHPGVVLVSPATPTAPDVYSSNGILSVGNLQVWPPCTGVNKGW
jgi:hypothetical protein